VALVGDLDGFFMRLEPAAAALSPGIRVWRDRRGAADWR
jgi:hypothetical protein